MSVIIRLQNLPWSANAMDIRQFFQGLSIPDGGVHIVGGEMGDAFIAFSTDEDARQAMMLDRGKLKETQVRLLLSSRAEMQKVIETARQTSLTLMQAAAAAQQQQKQMTPISKLMQQAPQPPVITPTSLNKILSQQPNDNSMQSYQSFAGNQSINENSMDSRDSKDRTTSSRRGRDRFGRSSRSRSKSRERRRSRSRERSSRRRRDHSRSRSHERRSRRRRSRSNDRSYDHDDNRRDRNQRDRGAGNKSEDAVIISDDNDMNMSKKDVNMGMGAAMGNARMWGGPQPQLPVFQTNMTKGYSTCGSNQNDVPAASIQGNQINQATSNIFNAIKQQQQQQQQQQPFRSQQIQQDQRLQQQQQQQQQPIFSSNMHIQSSKDQNDQNKPIYNFQSFFKTNYGQSGQPSTGNNSNTSNNASKSIAFQNPYTVASMANSTNDAKPPFGNSFAGMFNKNDDSKRGALSPKDDSKGILSPTNRNPDNKNAEINFDELEGNCIKISNMCPSTTYSELRRFFSGLYIANNGIKMINDKHGLRIGVAFVRFVRRESKPKAFIRNGSALKSKHIVMESVTEDDFEEAVDSFKPTRRFGRYEDDKKDTSRIRDNNSPRRNDEPIEIEKPKFNNLCLQDVPVFAKEQDIMKMFSSYTLTDIVLTKDEENRKQMVCFVKFHRAEDAKNALDETATHMIGHKKVFVSPCTDERFDRAKDKFNMQEDDEEDERDDDMNEDKAPIELIDEDNSGDRNEIEESNEVSKQANEDQHTVDDAESNKKDDGNSNSNDRGAPQIPSLLGLSTRPPNDDGPSDPRRRGSSRQGTRFSRPDDNQNNTNYALIKNCDYKLSKRDFVEFFSSAAVVPVRVEILFNARHQPSGECICEFANSEDAEKSLFKSNYYCGNRSVRIELISPAEVAKRLGDSYVQQNTNNGGNNNMNSNFNSNMPNFNQFGNNSNRGGGGGFNDNFNGNNFQPQQDTFRNNSNSMPPLQGNMGGGGGGDRFNNRNNRTGRGQRQSRFSDFDDNKSSGGGNNSMGGGNNNMGNMPMGNNQMPNLSPQVLGDTSVDLFGQPGCVIGMENVPYKATIDDIMEFFAQYNIQPQNIIRRYNDDGTPTGDARVAFNTPMAARDALESKRQQKILSRTIFLTIV